MMMQVFNFIIFISLYICRPESNNTPITNVLCYYNTWMKNLMSDLMLPSIQILNICQMNMTEAFREFTNFYNIELLFYNYNK